MKAPEFNLPIKPGHTTTEFWLVVIVGLLSTLLEALSLLDVAWGLGATSVLTLIYMAQRSKLKTIQAETEAHVIKANTDGAQAASALEQQLQGLREA